MCINTNMQIMFKLGFTNLSNYLQFCSLHSIQSLLNITSIKYKLFVVTQWSFDKAGVLISLFFIVALNHVLRNLMLENDFSDANDVTELTKSNSMKCKKS